MCRSKQESKELQDAVGSDLLRGRRCGEISGGLPVETSRGPRNDESGKGVLQSVAHRMRINDQPFSASSARCQTEFTAPQRHLQRPALNTEGAQWPHPSTLGIRGGAGPPVCTWRAVLSRLSHRREDGRRHQPTRLRAVVESSSSPRKYTKSTQPRAQGSVRVCFRHQ